MPLFTIRCPQGHVSACFSELVASYVKSLFDIKTNVPLHCSDSLVC